MVVADVEELGAGEALVAFGDLRRIRDRASRDIFVLAAHFADLYHVVAGRDGGLRTAPGSERAIKVAGDGAPLVAEFAIAEMAAELGMTTWSARRLVGDALETRHRLPKLWARVLADEAPTWIVSKVAQATRELTRVQAATVDSELAEYADGRLPWSRFAELLAAKVVDADPEAAAERERVAAEARFAKVGQSNDHGQKTLYVKTGAAEMTRIDATIAYLADGLRSLGDTGDEDLRRTKAVLLMANPTEAVALLRALRTAPKQGDGPAATGRPDGVPPEGTGASPEGSSSGPDAFFTPFRPGSVPDCPCRGGRFELDTHRLLPTVVLYLHLHAETLTRGNGVARWEGEGPISALYIRDFLGPHANFVVKPVIDPATMSSVDGYETPDRLREALHLRTPADVFPFAPNTGRKKQTDHTIPYRPPRVGGPPGQTGLDNLGSMTSYHHRVKTHAGWTLKQPYPGVYLWRSPHGSIFLVDNTGTRQLRRPRSPARVGGSQLEQRLQSLVDAA